jgi:hypothetical protein
VTFGKEKPALLPRSQQQEALSLAYVRVVAGKAGMAISVPSPDSGIDLSVHDVIHADKHYVDSGWRLDIQVKSTTLAVLDAAHVRYDLEVAAYNVLRATGPGCPRILVVFVLPVEEARWVGQTEDELLLRRACYWASLCGHPPTSNRKTVRVTLSRANLFTPESLQGLIEQAKRGEAL